MANVCSYVMKVVGEPKDIREFHKILNEEKNNNPHFYTYTYGGTSNLDEKEVESGSAIIWGQCKWSVYSSMMIGEYTNHSKDLKMNPDTLGTNLEEISGKLNLLIEVYSEEYGMCFEEHYLFDNGFMLLEEVLDAERYPRNEHDTVEAFNKEFGLEISIRQFNNTIDDDWIVIGGFGKDAEFII